MAKSLAFAQFMSNQGLSHSEIAVIFNCTSEESRNWANGSAPQEINQTAIIINQILERQKLKDMPDIDRQHFEHRSEVIVKENEELKAENSRLRKAIYEYDKARKAKSKMTIPLQ
jgi:hypothetical protein